MERRRCPRWRTDGKQVHLHVQGRRTQRCNVLSVSAAGLFIETNTFLPEGLPVELAFKSVYTDQLVKVFRRSAYVARSSDNGLAVLFFGKRAA